MSLSPSIRQKLATVKLGTSPNSLPIVPCLQHPEQRQQHTEANLQTLIQDAWIIGRLAVERGADDPFYFVRELSRDAACQPIKPTLTAWPLTIRSIAPAGYRANIVGGNADVSQPSEQTSSPALQLARLVVLNSNLDTKDDRNAPLYIADCAATPDILHYARSRGATPSPVALSHRSSLGANNPLPLRSYTRSNHLATIDIDAIETGLVVFAAENQLV